MKFRPLLAFVALALLATPHSAAAARLDPAFGDGGVVDLTAEVSSPADVVIDSLGGIAVVGSHYGPTNEATATAVGMTAAGQINQSFGASRPGSTDFDAIGRWPQAVATVGGATVIAGDGSAPGEPPGSGSGNIHLAKMLSDGRPDPSFGSNGIVDTGIASYGPADLAALPDGRIVLTADLPPSTQVPLGSGVLIARLLADGSLDASFSGDGIAIVEDPSAEATYAGPIAAFDTGAVVVAGDIYRSEGSSYESRSVLFKLAANGELDRDFGVNGFKLVPDNYSDVSDLAVAPRGRVIGVGDAPIDGVGLDHVPQVFAYDSETGGLVRKFADKGVATITAAGFGDLSTVIIQPGGRILVGGVGNQDDDALESGGDGGDFLLARLTSKGYADRSFAPGGALTTDFERGSDRIVALDVQPTGRIVTVGTHGYYNFRGPNTSYTYVAAYDPGPRVPDPDRDGRVGRGDRCPKVEGDVRGCPRLNRSVTLQLLRGRHFTGNVRASDDRCVRASTVKLIRRRGDTGSVIGVDRELEGGHFEVEAPSGPGRYRAAVARAFVPHAGLCAAVRSAALDINR